MKILVTVGTQEQKFDRLFEMIDKLDLTNHEVTVQSGTSSYQNDNFNVSSLISNFDDVLANCDLIITHGGVGTILSGLKHNKKIIAVARLNKYHEHVNDHQIEIVEKYVNEGFILGASNALELQTALENINKFTPKEFTSNQTNFLSKLEEIIGELC